MNFDENELQKLIQEASNYSNLELSQIPCIDLYMDQVISLFDDTLKDFKRNEDDKSLTKTMINNYIKSKVLMPAKNKKYSKNHIILLTLIYHLKQILPINDINSMFAPIIDKLENESTNSSLLENIYSMFLNIKNLEYKNFNDHMKKQLSIIDAQLSEINSTEKDLSKWILLLLTLINQANINKIMAEKILDKIFSPKTE